MDLEERLITEKRQERDWKGPVPTRTLRPEATQPAGTACRVTGPVLSPVGHPGLIDS